MRDYEELYEALFCSPISEEDRRIELSKLKKNEIDELRKEHSKNGIKINTVAIKLRELQ